MIFSLSLRNVRHYLRYTLATALVVAASFVALSLFSGYAVDVVRYMETLMGQRAMFGDVLIDRETPVYGDIPALNLEDQKYLDAYLSHSEDVTAYAKFLQRTGAISNGREVAIFFATAYEVQAGAALRGQTWRWDAAAGKPLQLAQDVNSISLGQNLSRLLGCTVAPEVDTLTAAGYPAVERAFSCPANKMTLHAIIGDGSHRTRQVNMAGLVRAAFADADKRLIMMPLSLAQNLYDTTDVTYYAIRLKNPEQSAIFLKKFRDDDATKARLLTATAWQRHRYGDLFVRSTDFVGIMDRYISAILLVISGLISYGSFTRLVSERAQEIGLFRALGFARWKIGAILGLEASITCSGGLLLGGVLAALATVLINSAQIPYHVFGVTEPIPFQISFEFPTYLRSGAFILVIGVASAMAAALAKLRRPIIENFAQH